MQTVKKYIRNVAVAVDQLANAVLLGDPDETISSRMGKQLDKPIRNPIPKLLCSGLDAFEKQHCAKSIEKDEGKDAILK